MALIMLGVVAFASVAGAIQSFWMVTYLHREEFFPSGTFNALTCEPTAIIIARGYPNSSLWSQTYEDIYTGEFEMQIAVLVTHFNPEMQVGYVSVEPESSLPANITLQITNAEIWTCTDEGAQFSVVQDLLIQPQSLGYNISFAPTQVKWEFSTTWRRAIILTIFGQHTGHTPLMDIPLIVYLHDYVAPEAPMEFE